MDMRWYAKKVSWGKVRVEQNPKGGLDFYRLGSRWEDPGSEHIHRCVQGTVRTPVGSAVGASREAALHQ